MKQENSFLAMFLLLSGSLILTELAEPAIALSGSSQRPNILFCIADDASYAHMGANGCSWVSTPGFDRVAREGLRFSRAYTPNAKCAPSRACILTGRNSWQLKEACNHWCYFPQEFTTYAEALARHGYFVGKTGKGWAPGVAKDAAGKNRLMTGKAFDRLKKQPPTNAISSNDYAGNFEAFLNEASLKEGSQGTPWCFWYGGIEPHRRYEYGSGVAKGGKDIKQIEDVPPFWPDNEVTRNDMLDYAYEIEHFDHHLQRMLKTLEQRGELENTLVVVTSDNGMPFPRIKGHEYESSNHLPLAIMWKKGITKPGRTIDDYVSFIDFTPTFLELAGLDSETSGMQPITGQSLVTIFQSEKSGQVEPARKHVLIGKERHDVGRPNDVGYPIRGIVREDMLYLINYETDRWPSGNPETGYLNCDGGPTKTEILNKRTQAEQGRYWLACFGKRPAEELFDLQADPNCTKNLASAPEHQHKKIALRKLLTKNLALQNDPRAKGNGNFFDKYLYADSTGRDFFNRYMSGETLKAGWVNPSDFEKNPLD